MIETIEDLITKIKANGVWIYRYGEIFYVKPECLKIYRDKEKEKFAREHPEHWIPTAEGGAIYELYFWHDEYPSTIATYAINWFTYKHRFALTREGLEQE